MSIVGQIYIRNISNEIARKLIVKNHYSHRWTICELALGIFCKGFEQEFLTEDVILGTIVFGPTAGVNVCKSISPLLNHENVYELKRMWIDDCLGRNVESHVISLSINYIRLNHSDIKCLVSYADPDAGHKGTIYQETNWIYQDIERPKNTSGYVFSFDEGKTWVHPLTLFNRYKTFNVDKLIEVIPRPFWTKELAVKHRYVYPLGDKKWKKKLVASFNYHHIQYPKENKNGTLIEKYEKLPTNNR